MVNTRPTTLAPASADENIVLWNARVALLEEWEQEEIQEVVKMFAIILAHYQSSAELAMIRVSLEIAKKEGM